MNPLALVIKCLNVEDHKKIPSREEICFHQAIIDGCLYVFVFPIIQRDLDKARWSFTMCTSYIQTLPNFKEPGIASLEKEEYKKIRLRS